MKQIYIAVIGASRCAAEDEKMAEEVGRELARRKAVLICGGRGGVMEAAARGASNEGGLVVGILPGSDRSDGNPYLTVALPTGMGNARNVLVAAAADVVIAVAGGYGTLSEIGFALKTGKPVVGLKTWECKSPGGTQAVIPVGNPREAVEMAFRLV